MEIFFSELARQIALILAGISLVGMMTFFVSYFVTRIGAHFRTKCWTPSTSGELVHSDVKTPEGQSIVAEIVLLDSQPHLNENDRDEILGAEINHESTLQGDEGTLIASKISSPEGAIQAEALDTEEATKAPNESSKDSPNEIITEMPAKFVNEKKIEEIERIKKTETKSLQGDIYVSTVPHDDKKEKPAIEPTPASEAVSSEQIDTIKTHIRRKEYPKAHTLIVEGLSYDKDHRELNIFLAEIYETEGAYDHAELLYADIIRKHGKDAYLLSKLALMLSFGGKYETSLDLYREVLSIDDQSDDIIMMVMNLSAYLGYYEESFGLTERYLAKYPRHIDSLELQAKNTIELGYEERYQQIITFLRSLAGFDARTHARVAELIALHDTKSGK